MIKVSVIIATFGRKNELRRAVLSITNQSFKEIEIIIIDDNVEKKYSDYIAEMIKEINDSRIIYVKNKCNLGGALSRNVGIKMAHGKYVAFLDDDDYSLPNRIEDQLSLFEGGDNGKLALVYCYCDEVRNGKVTFRVRYDYVGNTLYIAMIKCIASTSQWMCKKRYLDSVGDFTNMPCKQDSYVILKLLAAGYEVDRVPKVLVIYDDNDRPRISSKDAKKRIAGETMLRELCRKNYDKISNMQQRKVEYHFACVLAPYYYEIRDGIQLRKMLKIINSRFFSKKSLRIYKVLVKAFLKKVFMV